MNCFKKYDVRGIVGSELNEDIAKNIGAALAVLAKASTAVIGCDARASSPSLKNAIIEGLILNGVHVYDIGITGTEEVYYACQHLQTDIGIEVTASHNPIEYNGVKFVSRGAKPFNDEEFQELKKLSQSLQIMHGVQPGQSESYDHMPAYIEHLLSYVDVSNIKPLKIVVNAGNGVAGHVIDAIEQKLQIANVALEFVKIFHKPDSTFPNGIPNPLLEDDRWKTTQAIKEHGADLGIAWDGDFDRCFLFDENGEFIDGYYVVGLLAKSFLSTNHGEKIVHDPRVYWNTKQVVEQAGGELIKSRTGHALIKATMRQHDAIYGGEMSAHHYFKSFGYCDSGMIPWLLVVNLLSKSGNTISQEVNEMCEMYPCSGEINFRVENVGVVLERISSFYSGTALSTDMFDGLSMEFQDWRFNLRSSATEPVLRLNVESKANKKLLQEKQNELMKLISQ